MLGGLKGAKGLFRWRAVRWAAALQLGDTEPAVQRAALHCLKVLTPPSPSPYPARLCAPSVHQLVSLSALWCAWSWRSLR